MTSVLLPFRASWIRSTSNWKQYVYVPGCQQPPSFSAQSKEVETDDMDALFVYTQRFCPPGSAEELVHRGVVGLLGSGHESRLFRHEETLPDAVANCHGQRNGHGVEASSLHLWCDGDTDLEELLRLNETPWREVTDAFGSKHQFWRVTESGWIDAIQHALAGKDMFLADGHHRFAAGWQLATIQPRTPTLRPYRTGGISLTTLEERARTGQLLPPKSTDFFPKLIGQLLMHKL